jgi:hypothetical protein
MHPSSWRAFKRAQEHNLKHPSSVDLIGTKQNRTKQNKQTTFLHKYIMFIVQIKFFQWKLPRHAMKIS